MILVYGCVLPLRLVLLLIFGLYKVVHLRVLNVCTFDCIVAIAESGNVGACRLLLLYLTILSWYRNLIGDLSFQNHIL